MIRTMNATALVCCLLAVFALQIGASFGSKSSHRKDGHHGHSAREQGKVGATDQHSREQEAEDSIDAFNVDKCGAANFRPWQREQSAFGCAAAAAAAGKNEKRLQQQVPFEGEPPLVGEFPFYVGIFTMGHVNRQPVWESCSGVLIHRDIVLTTNETCRLRTLMNLDIGTKKFVRRSRSRLCVLDNFWAIQLDKPVDYVPGEIGPACLRTTRGGGGSPSNKSRCALVAHCAPKGAEFYQVDGNMILDKSEQPLLTMPMERDNCPVISEAQTKVTWDTCYRPQNGAGRCRYDWGAPVVCYDKCSKSDSDKSQAFVVGLLSQVNKSLKEDHNPISVIGLHDKREHIIKLVRALRSKHNPDSEVGITCINYNSRREDH